METEAGFSLIPGASVILRKGGRFSKHEVYSRRRYLYARTGSSFVALDSYPLEQRFGLCGESSVPGMSYQDLQIAGAYLGDGLVPVKDEYGRPQLAVGPEELKD